MKDDLNFEDEVKRLLRQEPFTPFEVILSSGDRYRVADPFYFAMGPSVVVILNKKGTATFRKNQLIGLDVPNRAGH